MAPRFDTSLASVARELYLGPIAAAALAMAAVAFFWLERRGRTAWARVPVETTPAADRAPYRSSVMVSRHLDRAPPLVRCCCFATLLCANALTPLALVALFKFPFDGVAIPLVPGVVLLTLNGVSAWLFLSRSPHAATAAHSGAHASLIACVGMVCIGAVHLVTVEMQRQEGIEHACSTSVTLVVVLFALGSGAQALATLAALRAHGARLRWSPPMERRGKGESAAAAAAAGSPSFLP